MAPSCASSNPNAKERGLMWQAPDLAPGGLSPAHLNAGGQLTPVINQALGLAGREGDAS